MSVPISISIIAFNEAHIISKCLEKLSWANEIVVVDSGSTDETVSICESFGAKVIYNKFENFGLQKQFALEQTKNNWVLSLDADEVLSDKLIEELKAFQESDVVGYKIPRTHIFLDKVFKYGSESKRPILRFFNKKKGRFTKSKVHEVIEVDGKIDTLKNEMLHFTVFNISTAINKQIKYALLSGELYHEKNKKVSVLKIAFKFPIDFCKVYFLQRNFLNGYEGFLWSMFSAFSSFLKYVKLYDLRRLSSK